MSRQIIPQRHESLSMPNPNDMRLRKYLQNPKSLGKTSLSSGGVAYREIQNNMVPPIRKTATTTWKISWMRWAALLFEVMRIPLKMQKAMSKIRHEPKPDARE